MIATKARISRFILLLVAVVVDASGALAITRREAERAVPEE